MIWEILLIFDLLDFMVQSSMDPCFTKLWTNGFHWWSSVIFSLAYPSFFRFSFWSFLLKFLSVCNGDVTYVWLSDYMTKLFWSFPFYMFRNGVLYILYIQRSSDILIAWSIPNVTPLIIKLPHDSIFLLLNKKCALYIPISSWMWISLLVHMVFQILPKTVAASANLLSTLFIVFERIILKKTNSPIFFSIGLLSIKMSWSHAGIILDFAPSIFTLYFLQAVFISVVDIFNFLNIVDRNIVPSAYLISINIFSWKWNNAARVKLILSE